MGVGNAIKKQLQNMHGLHNLKGKARAFRAVHVPLVEAPQDSLIPVGESPEVSVVAILPRSSCSFDAVITLTGDTESEWSEIMSELEEQSVALNADLRRATEDSLPAQRHRSSGSYLCVARSLEPLRTSCYWTTPKSLLAKLRARYFLNDAARV